MITFLLCITVLIILAIGLLKKKEHYLLLSEVIPGGKIISLEEGIVSYKGVQYIFGTNDLKRKKYLLESLGLLNIEDSLIIDLRFSRQIIIKKRRTEIGKRRRR
ncbi:hypothetical protein BXT86_04735 [candidate division WOR-3 bacterium 4484_100]|uniref:POTRA domain-containing protein n=1 Tax=candidate division WOR-3 bacterium 4484_100 TaxID=1936077 RepID=A0A1V4QFZ1_UNCW3|nr:MAG: hypothetical protein BXT86_04735 [candidate division WOR-3 bacterium 4484_100]